VQEAILPDFLFLLAQWEDVYRKEPEKLLYSGSWLILEEALDDRVSLPPYFLDPFALMG
jgi:hypothetical protein